MTRLTRNTLKFMGATKADSEGVDFIEWLLEDDGVRSFLRDHIELNWPDGSVGISDIQEALETAAPALDKLFAKATPREF